MFLCEIQNDDSKYYVRLEREIEKLKTRCKIRKKAWNKKFIYIKTELGAKADTQFGKHILTNLNMSFYVKQIENRRITLQFPTDYESYVKQQPKCTFCGRKKNEINGGNLILSSKRIKMK